jgi:primary-amine oxidase
MVVPYGDPSPTQHRKNAFDQGEYGLGYLTNSLALGCDCLGEIRYLDVTLCDSAGKPYVIPNAICLHEEDDGILWKHIDFRTQHAEVRRSRRLVASFITTVGNYEYAFYWRFYQDGTIEHDIKLTGIMTTGTVGPGRNAPYGQLLNDEGLYSPIHQHFFNYRLDLDVNGQDNAVYEVNTVAPPSGDENPHGNAFRAVSTLLERETDARRVVHQASNRYWKIVNRTRRNRIGEPVAYRLVPQSGTLPYWAEDSYIARRAGFASKHLWVTPNDPTELYAGGTYPNQNPGPDGLPVWTERDRELVDRDVVVWYSFGSHHVPRLEDWPVMPAQHVGFKLEPCGFFDENPALDVAPAQHDCAAHGSAPPG